MRFLLDRMHDELNRIASKPKYKEVDFSNLAVADQSESWFRYYR